MCTVQTSVCALQPLLHLIDSHEALATLGITTTCPASVQTTAYHAEPNRPVPNHRRSTSNAQCPTQDQDDVGTRHGNNHQVLGMQCQVLCQHQATVPHMEHRLQHTARAMCCLICYTLMLSMRKARRPAPMLQQSNAAAAQRIKCDGRASRRQASCALRGTRRHAGARVKGAPNMRAPAHGAASPAAAHSVLMRAYGGPLSSPVRARPKLQKWR